MPVVTPEQLIEALLAHPSKGAKQAVLVTRTRPKLLKHSRVSGEPCPFIDGVERLALRRVTLGASYEAAVNRQRLKEQGDGVEAFTPEPLWNGRGVWDTAYTVRHATTGRRYLAVKPAQREAATDAGSVAVVIQDQWSDVATGRVLDFERDCLGDYLPAAQAKSERQQVEHDVQWRTIALESIVELRYGQVYEVAQAEEAKCST